MVPRSNMLCRARSALVSHLGQDSCPHILIGALACAEPAEVRDRSEGVAVHVREMSASKGRFGHCLQGTPGRVLALLREKEPEGPRRVQCSGREAKHRALSFPLSSDRIGQA